jgi:TetR/AcrR family transcriptional regulator of autoinduction and epiphytic fitness
MKKRSMQKRATILDASTRVFLEKGYSESGMTEIAAEAEVSTATLYSHFAGKAELFDAVVERLWHKLRPEEEPEAWEMPPEQALTHFGRNVLKVLLSPTSLALFRVVIAQASRFPEMTQAFRYHGDEAITQALAQYLSRQTKLGVLAASQPDQAARQFLGMVKEAVFWPRVLGVGKPPSKREVENAVTNAVSIFLKSYRRP